MTVTFFCRSPKKPTNVWPKGDIDNHQKAILDVLNEWAWKDDVQIMKIVAVKCYSKDPRIEIEWKEHGTQGIGVRTA